MVSLEREPTPEILVEKGVAWTARYLHRRASEPKLRPDKDQYRHPEVLRALQRMSRRKCFYCERVLPDSEQKVDHYIEVAERPDLAFTWGNLYLSCEGCNEKKVPNLRLPATTCVDPCDPATPPGDHIVFVDERVEPRAGSPRGRATIDKYGLDRQELDIARARTLRDFDRTLIEILQQMAREGRKSPSEREVALLRAFADPSRPFSRMIADRLNTAGL